MRVNLGALHGNGDAVEENDNEDHMVKHLVRDDPVTQEAKPAPGQKPKLSRRQAGQQGGHCLEAPIPPGHPQPDASLSHISTSGDSSSTDITG